MDRLEAMLILLQAVESGSLSKASRHLGLPLATVSRKVTELETHLNAILLTRSSKGLTPTPAGRSYIIAAKAVLEQLNEAERAASGEYITPRGDLVVTAPGMLGRLQLLPVIGEFLETYPEVNVSLMLTERVTNLLDEHIDVALRLGDLPDSMLTASRLGSVRPVVCASPAYLAKRGRPRTLEDLAHHDAISFEKISLPGVWRFVSGGAEVEPPLRSRLRVNTADAALDAALGGQGLLYALDYHVVEHVRQGKLQTLLGEFASPPRQVHLAYNKHSRLPLKLRAFIDFVTPRLRERLGSIVL